MSWARRGARWRRGNAVVAVRVWTRGREGIGSLLPSLPQRREHRRGCVSVEQACTILCAVHYSRTIRYLIRSREK